MSASFRLSNALLTFSFALSSLEHYPLFTQNITHFQKGGNAPGNCARERGVGSYRLHLLLGDLPPLALQDVLQDLQRV